MNKAMVLASLAKAADKADHIGDVLEEIKPHMLNNMQNARI